MMERRPASLAPGTCTCIATYARHQPAGIAIVHRGVAVTWRILAANVLAVVDDLQAQGLRRGQTVGIEVDDRYLHLLIVLAAEAFGLTTISLSAEDLGPHGELVRLCDRLIVSRCVAAHAGKAWIITPDWAVGVLTKPGDRPLEGLHVDPGPDTVLRLMTTSGTTGRPKVMAMTQALLQALVRSLLEPLAPDVASHLVFVCLYRFTMRAAYTRTMLTLQRGGTVHFTGSDVLWDLVAAGTGNYLFMVSGDLERFVRAAPSGVGPFDVHIDVVGGVVPDRLRAETRAKISARLVTSYATNETHYVTRVGEGAVGRLYPGVEVRIVDERGAPVARGGQGLIQVRTPTMVTGYVDAPDQDRAAFVNGWYHTADIGYQPDSETLVVLGRADDTLNIGGVKIPPAPLEARLKDIEGVQDVLVTDLADQLMTSAMLVAVELRPGADRASVARRIDPEVRSYVSLYHMLAVPALPRTETGKIRRDAVRDLYRRQARSG